MRTTPPTATHAVVATSTRRVADQLTVAAQAEGVAVSAILRALVEEWLGARPTL